MITFEWGRQGNKAQHQRQLLNPDQAGEIVDTLELYQRVAEMSIFGPNQAATSERNGTRYQNQYPVGLPRMNWPEPCRPELNTLYWPVTGATRWAAAVYLVRGEDVLVEPNEKQGRDGPPFGLKTGCLILEGPDPKHNLRVPMTALPAHHIGYGLALQPFCCARYFWQFQRTDSTVNPSGGTTWDDMVTSLKAQLGSVTLEQSTIDADYLDPDWREFFRGADNPAVLLDAVAASVGCRNVFYPRHSNPTIPPTTPSIVGKLESPQDAKQVWDTFSRSKDRDTILRIFGTPTSLTTLEHLPEKTTVFFTRFRDFHPVEPDSILSAGYYLKQQNNVAGTGQSTDAEKTWRVVSSAFADYSSQDSGVVGTPDNDAKLELLANQIAKDWTAWLDPAYTGYDHVAQMATPLWPFSGYDDTMTVRSGYRIDRGDETRDRGRTERPSYTRIQSLPANVLPETQLSQDPDLYVLGDLEFAQLVDDLASDTPAVASILRGEPGSEATLSPDRQVKVWPWPNRGLGDTVKPVGIGSDPRSSELSAGTKVWLFWHTHHAKWYVLPSPWHYGVADEAIPAATLSGGDYEPTTSVVSLYFFADDGKIKDTGINVDAINWGLVEIAAGSLVSIAQHPQSGRWSVVGPPEGTMAIGVLTYTGPLTVSNATQIPFDTVVDTLLMTLDSNGLLLDNDAPTGRYLMLLQVDCQFDDDYTLDDFSDAAFDTAQNTALDTRFKRDYLGSEDFSAFINSLNGLQQSHLHRRTASGVSYYGQQPFSSIHLHGFENLGPADTVKGYIDIPLLSVNVNINEAQLTAIYLGP